MAVDIIGIIISASLCYKVFQFFLFVYFLSSFVVLSQVAGFNIFKTLGYLQKEYGMMLAVSQVLAVMIVCWDFGFDFHLPLDVKIFRFMV